MAALLGGSIISYEVTGGLCFGCSSASSATRHGDPNLHLSRMARLLCKVSEPFYRTVVIFGGVQIHTADRYGIAPLHPDQEQADGFDPLNQGVLRRPPRGDRARDSVRQPDPIPPPR